MKESAKGWFFENVDGPRWFDLAEGRAINAHDINYTVIMLGGRQDEHTSRGKALRGIVKK